MIYLETFTFVFCLQSQLQISLSSVGYVFGTIANGGHTSANAQTAKQSFHIAI